MGKIMSDQVCRNFIERFKDNLDIRCSGCSGKTEKGNIIGEYNGVPFFISFSEDRVVVIVDSKSKEVAEVMRPFLCLLFKEKNPSFQYECGYRSPMYNPNNSFVLEWTNEENRGEELAKLADPDEYGIGFFPGSKIHSLSSYVEEKPIYGINPGDLLNPDEVREADECTLFYLIYGILFDIASNSDKMDSDALEKRNFALDFAIYKLKVLGFVDGISDPEHNKRISYGSEFISWFDSCCTKYNRKKIEAGSGKEEPNGGRSKSSLPKSIIK